MHCEDVRQSLSGGALAPSLEAHLQICPDCAAFAVQRGMAISKPAVPDLDRLRVSLDAALAAERGALAFLRSRSSRARVGFAAATGLVLAALVAGLRARADLGELRPGTFAALALLGLGYLALLPEALRPLHLPARPERERMLVPLALTLPVLAALLAAATARPLGIPSVHGCLGMGLAAAGLLLGLLVALDRRGLAGRGAGLLAVSAAAALANFVLALHCPNERLHHLLLWHAPVGFWLALGYVGFANRRVPSRSR